MPRARTSAICVCVRVRVCVCARACVCVHPRVCVRPRGGTFLVSLEVVRKQSCGTPGGVCEGGSCTRVPQCVFQISMPTWLVIMAFMFWMTFSQVTVITKTFARLGKILRVAAEIK